MFLLSINLKFCSTLFSYLHNSFSSWIYLYPIHLKTRELKNAVCLLFIYRRGPGVSCVLQFGFRADRYNGVVALQDALTMKNMLHFMTVKTHYLSSTDGKGQRQTVSYSSKDFLVRVLLGKNQLSVYQRLWEKLTDAHWWTTTRWSLRTRRIVLQNYNLHLRQISWTGGLYRLG